MRPGATVRISANRPPCTMQASDPSPATGFRHLLSRDDTRITRKMRPQFRAKANGAGDGNGYANQAGPAAHDAGGGGAQLRPGKRCGRGQEIVAARGVGMAAGVEQAVDQVMDVNGGEEAVAAGDFENHPAGDGFENPE